MKLHSKPVTEAAVRREPRAHRIVSAGLEFRGCREPEPGRSGGSSRHALPGAPTRPSGAAVASSEQGSERAIRATRTLGILIRSRQQDRQIKAVLIPRHERLPASKTCRFRTAKDNQRRIHVSIVEGDSPDPSDCSVVGECEVTGLPPNLPEGSPVQVRFSVDRDGRLQVQAVDLSTETVAKAVIRRCDLAAASGPSPEAPAERAPIDRLASAVRQYFCQGV